MTIEQKQKDRRLAFWLGFGFISLFTIIMFIFHLFGFEVISFFPIFSSTTAALTGLGITNYITAPKDLNKKDLNKKDLT